MSDEQKKDDNAKNEFQTALEVLNKTIEEKMSSGFKSIDEKIDSKMADKHSDDEPNEGLSIDESEDDGAYVTKKDLKQFGQSLLKATEKTVENTADTVFEKKTNKQMRDAQAVEHIPLLNRNGKHYSQAFYNEVNDEVKRRLHSGRSHLDPDLIYDAAVAIEKKWIDTGKYVPQTLATKMNSDRNANDDNFDINGGGSNSKTPNASQIELAKRFGLSTERLTQHMKKTS